MRQVTPISPALLSQFEQSYASRPYLAVMSNAISRTDLNDASFVPAAAAKLRMDFSVVVPTTGITNQKKSGRCWMFSVLNALREQVIQKCHLEDFAFSATYLAFYDKLEKCNLFYENILYFAGQKLDDRETWTLLGNPLPDGGQWDMVASLIRKYGVVPEWVMPENVHSTGTAQYMPILSRKLRKDALELRSLAQAGKETAARRTEMLQEDYNALCILYGQPIVLGKCSFHKRRRLRNQRTDAGGSHCCCRHAERHSRCADKCGKSSHPLSSFPAYFSPMGQSMFKLIAKFKPC